MRIPAKKSNLSTKQVTRKTAVVKPAAKRNAVKMVKAPAPKNSKNTRVSSSSSRASASVKQRVPLKAVVNKKSKPTKVSPSKKIGNKQVIKKVAGVKGKVQPIIVRGPNKTTVKPISSSPSSRNNGGTLSSKKKMFSSTKQTKIKQLSSANTRPTLPSPTLKTKMKQGTLNKNKNLGTLIKSIVAKTDKKVPIKPKLFNKVVEIKKNKAAPLKNKIGNSGSRSIKSSRSIDNLSKGKANKEKAKSQLSSFKLSSSSNILKIPKNSDGQKNLNNQMTIIKSKQLSTNPNKRNMSPINKTIKTGVRNNSLSSLSKGKMEGSNSSKVKKINPFQIKLVDTIGGNKSENSRNTNRSPILPFAKKDSDLSSVNPLPEKKLTNKLNSVKALNSQKSANSTANNNAKKKKLAITAAASLIVVGGTYLIYKKLSGKNHPTSGPRNLNFNDSNRSTNNNFADVSNGHSEKYDADILDSSFVQHSAHYDHND
jgi:hypothetical protein